MNSNEAEWMEILRQVFFAVLQELMDDVTIVQEKKGNCDEVNIDKVWFVLTASFKASQQSRYAHNW